MTVDSVLGWVPMTGRGPLVRLSSARQAEELLGRLDAPGRVSEALVTVFNLFMNGADRVVVAPVGRDPSSGEIAEAAARLANTGDVRSVSVPDKLSLPAIEAAAAAVRGTAAPSPLLLVHGEPDVGEVSQICAWGAAAVVPPVSSQPPGRVRPLTLSGATLAVACLRAGSDVIRGLHTVAPLAHDQLARLHDAGAATLVPVRRGRRPSISLRLPANLRLPPLEAPAPVASSLEARLQAIVDAELAADPFGDLGGRIVRLLTAALQEATRRGELDGAGGRPFVVVEGSDGAIEVVLRRRARPATAVTLRVGHFEAP